MAAPAFAATNFYLELGPVKGDKSAATSAGGERIDILSWSWGAARKGWDGTIKGATSAEKFGAMGGMHRDADVATTSPRDASSGLATGKRQHQPKGRTAQLDQAKPLDEGSVTIDGSVPGCTVGATYADARLQGAAAGYELKDVQITSCLLGSVNLYYAKVTVRGWDPATKKE